MKESVIVVLVITLTVVTVVTVIGIYLLSSPGTEDFGEACMAQLTKEFSISREQ